MPSLRRSIPSMNALATFEAAARLGSFTQAAAELGVTQAAVSRQIRLLEDDLNTALFVRAHRKVVLTQSGAALAGTVTGAFSGMAEMIEAIRQPHVADTVTVGATLAFSHLWILPRLSAFRAAHPEIKLKLIADDSATDLRRDRLDVVIRFGTAPFLDGQSIASQPDEVFPVCSPKLLHRLGLEPLSADPARLPLLTSDIVNPAWLTWKTWALAAGLGPAIGKASDQSRLRFNHYTDSIEAAVNGEGVALGWAMLLSGHLRAGRLVRLGAARLVTEGRYHVVIPAARKPTAATKLFLDWIAGQFETPSPQPRPEP